MRLLLIAAALAAATPAAASCAHPSEVIAETLGKWLGSDRVYHRDAAGVYTKLESAQVVWLLAQADKLVPVKHSGMLEAIVEWRRGDCVYLFASSAAGFQKLEYR